MLGLNIVYHVSNQSEFSEFVKCFEDVEGYKSTDKNYGRVRDPGNSSRPLVVVATGNTATWFSQI